MDNYLNHEMLSNVMYEENINVFIDLISSKKKKAF